MSTQSRVLPELTKQNETKKAVKQKTPLHNRQGLPNYSKRINTYMVNALPFKGMFTNIGLLWFLIHIFLQEKK